MEDGRIIRRVDIHYASSAPSPSISDHAIEAKLLERYRKYLVSIEEEYSQDVQAGHLSAFDQGDGDAEKEQRGEQGTFDFHLFSKPISKPLNSLTSFEKPLRITIASPSPSPGEPGFKHPRRPSSYYLARLPSAAEKAEYRASALSGQDVINGSHQRWRGSELPWRVMALKIAVPRTCLDQIQATKAREPGRKRPGKKMRISNRKRTALVKTQKAGVEIDRLKKGVAEEERRVRRNREKKLKRKERTRLQKASISPNA